MSQITIRNKTTDFVSLPHPITITLKPSENRIIQHVKMDDTLPVYYTDWNALQYIMKTPACSVYIGLQSGILTVVELKPPFNKLMPPNQM